MLARLSHLVRALFHRSAMEREMDEEMRFHVEQRAEDLVREGLDPDEARRRARLEFGAVADHTEECRAAVGLRPFDDARADVRFALRAFRRNPAFTATAVLTLALGIGAITTIFSAVKAVLLSELPYAEAGRLVALGESDDGGKRPETIGFTTAVDWQRLSHSFTSMSLYRDASAAILRSDGAELVSGLRVSWGFFDTVGVRVALGRTFRPEEDRPDTRYEVVLAHSLWTRSFGADPAVVGRVVVLNEKAYTVVGVLPESFRSLQIPGSDGVPEFFAPLGYALSDPFACRSCQHLHLVGRLKAGVSPAQAHAELTGIMSELARRFPKDYPAKAGVALQPLREHLVSPVATALWVLGAAVAVLLLMACVNVASLLLARAAGREREIALRAALGAGRGRLVRQLLTESLVLAAIGGGLGLALGAAGVSALAALAPRELPRVDQIRMDAGVAAICLAASLATGVLFGLAPAWRASRPDLEDALRQAGKTTADKARGALRAALAGLQIALAFVLLVGAALLGRSLARLVDVDPGFDPRNVLTLKTFVYGSRYKEPAVELAYYERVAERLRATPGITAAAFTSTLPLVDFDRYGFHVRDQPLARASEAPAVDHYAVSPDYFRVMKIGLVKGRAFTPADDARAGRVAVVSKTCARELFAGRDPIGKEIQLGDRRDDKPWITIVGVVDDVRQTSLGAEPHAAAYVPLAQSNGSFLFSLVARTDVAPRLVEPAVREAFREIDPTLPVYSVRPMEEILARSLATRRFTLTLLSLFGALALTLAAVGIYGVFAGAVAARTREIGIRMALGARRSSVLGSIMGQASRLAGLGLAAGLLGSLAAARLLGSLLYGVTPTDPAALAAAFVGCALVALASSFVPARRAASVDPAITLRNE